MQTILFHDKLNIIQFFFYADNCLVGKHNALTVAVNEAEVSSVEETDEDDEATLYILSEMFSMHTILVGDG